MIASAWVRWRMRLGAALLVTLAGAAILAPVIAPNDPNSQFQDKAYAPPMRVRIVDGGGIRAPFVRQQVLEDRLARRYRDSDTTPLTLIWFSDGRLVTLDPGEGPLLLLGADSLGRDLFRASSMARDCRSPSPRSVWPARWFSARWLAGWREAQAAASKPA